MPFMAGPWQVAGLRGGTNKANSRKARLARSGCVFMPLSALGLLFLGPLSGLTPAAAAGLVVVVQQPCAAGYLTCQNDNTTPSCCCMPVGIVGVCCRRIARGPGLQLTAPQGAAKYQRQQQQARSHPGRSEMMIPPRQVDVIDP